MVVESPAKIATLSKFVGPEYELLACSGHVRALPSKPGSVAPDRGFEMVFEQAPSKGRVVQALVQAARRSSAVVLATDPDREGEAIAWHVCQIGGLPVETTPRMIFSEITRPALERAVRSLGTIDVPLVEAQLARQALDLWIGFHFSPLLWRDVDVGTTRRPRRGQGKGKGSTGPSLSAGRCQTPALRIVYDNEAEVSASWEKAGYEYATHGYFGRANVRFALDAAVPKAEVADFMRANLTHKHALRKGPTGPTTHSPPTPLTTSRLQQAASTHLRMGPKETMQHAQRLYERGLITYMRTDSTNYSPVFVEEARNYIEREFGAVYLGVAPHKKSAKAHAEEAQAHEAIRPTDVRACTPPDATAKERRLYSLIWTTTVQSCMSACRGEAMRVELSSPIERAAFICRAERIVFDGWRRAAAACGTHGQLSGAEAETETEAEAVPASTATCVPSGAFEYLASLSDGHIVPYSSIKSEERVVGLAGRYTESRLVQRLERLGIGRPSTYAGLVDKLFERDYVRTADVPGITRTTRVYAIERGATEVEVADRDVVFGAEKARLVLTDTGRAVMDYLQAFGVFQYDYTSLMEGELDRVATGEVNRHEICARFYAEVLKPLSPIETATTTATSTMATTMPPRILAPTMSVRKGAYGTYVYYKKPTARKPTFLNVKDFEQDPWTCDAATLLDWLRERYRATP